MRVYFIITVRIRLKFTLADTPKNYYNNKFILRIKMSTDECHCTEFECDSRSENELEYTNESTVEIQNINMEKNSSIVIEVLKKIDTDKMKKISLQNTKLSSIFPKASSLLLLYITILYIIFYLSFLLY